jgi:CRP-like cAMP-binding protein
VLDDVPAIASELAPGARAAARRVATASVVRLEPGPAALQRWYATTQHGPGLLVLRGVLACEVHVVDRTSTELLGPGDLLRPWELGGDEPVPCRIVWRVLERTDLALLDAFFADRIRPWPQLASELMAGAVRRTHSLAVERAIARHPRADVRVALLLWHLAGRWGRVQSDGSVLLSLPLTHRLIGELVGAERPSVSHALTRLAEAGAVVRDDAGWHLRGTPVEATEAALRPLPTRGADPRQMAREVIQITPAVAAAAAED